MRLRAPYSCAAAVLVVLSVGVGLINRPHSAMQARAAAQSRAPAAVDTGSAAPLPSLGGKGASIDSGAGTPAGRTLSQEFWQADDWFTFLHKYAAAAYAGDGRAAYYVWQASHACWAELDYYKTNGEIPQDYERCKRLENEDPFADLPPREGGYDRAYWKQRALMAGDPLAHLQRALTDEVTQAEGEQAIGLAVRSGDPEVYYALGLWLPAAGADFDEWAGWQLAACALGYDCAMSNPRIGMGCVENGSCQPSDTVETKLGDEAGLGALAQAQERAEAILAALEAGEVPEVDR